MKAIFFIVGWMFVGLNSHTQEVRKLKISEVEKMINEAKEPLIVNFWATFCKPCMEEIPYFQAMQVKYKTQGLKIIFVSLDMQDDYPGKVNSFVKKKKMSSYWLDETNADYFCPKIDQSWSGAIPASLFINNLQGYRKFVEEAMNEKSLEEEIDRLFRKPG
jgi:thiol-disulfide isomerase/thioredoxin